MNIREMTFHEAMEENAEKDRDKVTEGEGESRSCSTETSLVVQWLRLYSLDTERTSSISSQRTKIPHAARSSQRK